MSATDFDQPIGLLDLLPTMNGLCGVPNAAAFQGTDFSADIRAGTMPENDQFIAGYRCFGEYTRPAVVVNGVVYVINAIPMPMI